MKSKNRSAVHLGNLSANKRRETLGESAFRKQMKKIRAKGRQKGKAVRNAGKATNA